MKIALDYDGTYTEDPGLWYNFIKLALRRGHQVFCVTMRHGTEELELPFGIEVIFTRSQAKEEFCRKLGHEFDLWIDDQPYLILNDPPTL